MLRQAVKRNVHNGIGHIGQPARISRAIIRRKWRAGGKCIGSPNHPGQIMRGRQHHPLVRSRPAAVVRAVGNELGLKQIAHRRRKYGRETAPPQITVHRGPHGKTGIGTLGIGIAEGLCQKIGTVGNIVVQKPAFRRPETGAPNPMRAAAGLGQIGGGGVVVIQKCRRPRIKVVRPHGSARQAGPERQHQDIQPPLAQGSLGRIIHQYGVK